MERVPWATVPPGQQPAIYGMAAVSATDIWTVGSLLVTNSKLFELFEHWDGAAWKATTGPFRGFFTGVSASTGNDIWGVGCGNFSEHWDGSQWSFVPAPNVGTGPNCLNAVSALAPDDAWAVGYSTARATPPPGQFQVPARTLIEHWNGVTWNVVPTPNVGPFSQYQSNRLLGITAVSPTDIWAFGSYFAPSGSGCQYALLLHWDGLHWSLAPSPNPVIGNFLSDTLYGGVVTAPDEAWIVGGEQKSGHYGTLVLHTTGG